MESIATSVRVAGDAIGILSRLSEQLGQSKAQVIELALRQLEECIFWREVRDSFDRIASDPQEAESQRTESDGWERGTAADFHGEEW